MLFFFLSEISFYRFLRMRDFDFTKAKDAFLSYLKWREDYMVDAIPKVKDFVVNYIFQQIQRIMIYFILVLQHDLFQKP